MSISRREFMESAALGAAALTGEVAAAADPRTGMPMRVLGRTGAKVSILGFGAGSRFLMYKDEDKAAEALNKALDLGINYVDSAYSYGNGQSEERVGRILGNRRKNVWLVTKMNARKADDVMRVFEGSLKRLQTDHVDLLHIHALGDEQDLAAIEAPDGALKAFYKLRDQKAARFIGVTCHNDPAVLKTLLERHDLDCTQMALNAARVGRSPGGGALKPGQEKPESFELLALPVARRKKMGITAMKVFAQDQLIGKAPVETLLRYALTLPIAAAVAGMPKLEHIEENVRIAKAFKPLPKSEMKVIGDTLAGRHKLALDRYFQNHIDA